jgi:heme/copper-type cytochrome/quinol oxidase subunit 2
MVLLGLTIGAVVLMLRVSAPPARAQAQTEVPLTMVKDGFVPAELRVKAGQPFVLVVTNKDDITHELDISPLRIERKIRAGQTLRVQIPALKAGKYELEDDDSTPALKGLMIAE